MFSIFIFFFFIILNASTSGKILLLSNESSIITLFNDFDNMMELVSTYPDSELVVVLQETKEEIFTHFQQNFIFDRLSFTIEYLNLSFINKFHIEAQIIEPKYNGKMIFPLLLPKIVLFI